MVERWVWCCVSTSHPPLHPTCLTGTTLPVRPTPTSRSNGAQTASEIIEFASLPLMTYNMSNGVLDPTVVYLYFTNPFWFSSLCLRSPCCYIDIKFFLLTFSLPFSELSLVDWPLTWLTNHCSSVLWHCWLGHVTGKIVSEMTYNVSSGTLNPTIPYHIIPQFSVLSISKEQVWHTKLARHSSCMWLSCWQRPQTHSHILLYWVRVPECI